jgi:hypothetical protein
MEMEIVISEQDNDTLLTKYVVVPFTVDLRFIQGTIVIKNKNGQIELSDNITSEHITSRIRYSIQYENQSPVILGPYDFVLTDVTGYEKTFKISVCHKTGNTNIEFFHKDLSDEELTKQQLSRIESSIYALIQNLGADAKETSSTIAISPTQSYSM